MTDVRKEVHEEIDRMTEKQVVGLNKLLASDTSPLAIRLLNDPEYDELGTEEAERLALESMEWLRNTANYRIPH